MIDDWSYGHSLKHRNALNDIKMFPVYNVITPSQPLLGVTVAVVVVLYLQANNGDASVRRLSV